jgi:hypothetical protein
MATPSRDWPMTELACSFCNKPQSQAKKLWAGGIVRADAFGASRAYICNACVDSAFAAQVESGVSSPHVREGPLSG